MKKSKKQPMPKPINGHVRKLMTMSGAGVHGRSRGAERAHGKRNLKESLRQEGFNKIREFS